MIAKQHYAKRCLGLLVALAMVLSLAPVPYLQSAIAEEGDAGAGEDVNSNTESSYFFSTQIDTSGLGGKATFSSATINQETITDAATLTNQKEFTTSDGYYTIQFVFTANEGYEVQLRADGGSGVTIPAPTIEGNTYTFAITHTVTEAGTHNNFIAFNAGAVEKQGGDPGSGPVGGNDAISFDVTVTGMKLGSLAINNKVVKDDNGGGEFDTYEGTAEAAGTSNPSETNVITLRTAFGEKTAAKYTINGNEYTADNEGVQVEDDAWTITVPGASSYTITGEADESSTQVRTIIWANVDANQNAEDFDEDMLLQHGAGKIIAIYDEDGNLVEGEVDVDTDGMGWTPVEPGCKVVFEFVPEYGYQLTEVLANGVALDPQDAINQYTFTMPDNNVHFAAEFTAVEDVVKADSTKVSSGSIALDGSDLAGGTAQLTISDVTLGSDKISGFESAADEAGGYTVSDYLDIDLYNVFYKGKNDDGDVWSNKIDELNSEATISVVLAEGVDANDIVIVHNVHDGDTYEIIEIESYDPATRTITFKTSSFSNYAIASRSTHTIATGDTTRAGLPATGDQMRALPGLLAAMAACGLVMLFAAIRLRPARPHGKRASR